MAAFPILGHERNEVVYQPPGLRLIGVLALASSILAAAHDKCETRVRLHNQLQAEASSKPVRSKRPTKVLRKMFPRSRMPLRPTSGAARDE